MKKYNIIGSSSAGNCIRYFNEILVDIGLTYKAISPYLKPIKFILLTHIHGDHLQLHTMNMIAARRPDIIWLVPSYLMLKVDEINLKNIREVRPGKKYRLGKYKIEPVELYHDVPNIGYKIIKDDYKIIHATDTGKINHIEAKDFDLYAIEHNYDDDIFLRIKEKLDNDLFAHELRSIDTHLSFKKAQDWIYTQKKSSSEIVKLHVSSYYTKKEIEDER